MRNLLLLVFVVALRPSDALDAQNYIRYVEHLSENETFRAEFSQWSLKLFSQPDYLYGPTPRSFPCPTDAPRSTPKSVHQLRPQDVQCVAAMGDSLITGLASHALTLYDVLFENQGTKRTNARTNDGDRIFL